MIYLAIALLLGFLILVHELGHLVAAWIAGIPVARFSIGFGPKLWGWKPGRDRVCDRADSLRRLCAAGCSRR